MLVLYFLLGLFFVGLAYGCVKDAGWIGALAVAVFLGIVLYEAANADARPVPPWRQHFAMALKPSSGLLGIAAPHPQHALTHRGYIRRLRRFDLPVPPRISWVQSATLGGDPTAGMAPAEVPSDASGTIYYRQRLDRFDRAHETFHVLDNELLTGTDRARAMRIMGFKPGAAWWPQAGQTGPRTPGEWAADYYAAVATHIDPRREMTSAYAGNMTRRRLLRFASLLDQIAGRPIPPPPSS